MALQMQSFKNYVPFNIPITDIFMKKLVYVEEGEEDQLLETLFYVQKLEMRYPEESIDPDDPPEQIREDRLH